MQAWQQGPHRCRILEVEVNVAQTVMVVEDEYKLRELIRAYLEREGLEVFSTGSGAEAVRHASRGAGPGDPGPGIS